MGKSVAWPGEIVSVRYSTGGDGDTCLTTMPPCSFTNNIAHNDMALLEWQDGGAGGRFGKLVGEEDFVTCPANEVTHYECPDTLGCVSITVRLDDIPQAIDPATQQQIATANDDPITSGAGLIWVWDITSPSKSPLDNFVMSGDIPAEVLISCEASRAAYWSCMLGGELAAEWQGTADPATSKTLRVHTENHYHGLWDPRNETLPCSNSDFGTKYIHAEEWSRVSFVGRSFLLFFPRLAINNGTAVQQNQAVPNWYHYWKQTSANYGDHSYDPSCPAPGYGFCTWAGVVTIGPYAHTSQPPHPHEGIDYFALVCRHEAKHKADFSQWWPGGYYHPEMDADPGGDMNQYGGDGVHDDYEPGLGYDMWDPDTDDDGLKDMEDSAEDWSLAQWTLGDANSEDWAAPGKQY